MGNKIFKCRSCGEKYDHDFCATKDVSLCRWCSGEEPDHDHKCENCGEPATINLQNQWHEYEILPDGNFEEVKDWEGDCNEFYCDECYKKEMEK